MVRNRSITLGPADWVTLVRAVLVIAITVLVVRGFWAPVPVVPLVALSVAALLTDLLDGYVARRTGTVSAFGARFDMEVDAALILVLSVHMARIVGVWVLAIGLMRYVLWAAERLLPWLRGPVPPRFWRKVVASATGQTLAYTSSNLFPRWFVITALAVVLAMLVESFGRDIVHLWRTNRPGHVSPAR
jgi:phosphatidylglycerophosphate synthase